MTTPLAGSQRVQVTERIFKSPSKYVQGPAALQNAAKYLGSLGRAPLLTCDAFVYSLAGRQLIETLETANFIVTHVEFGGEASVQEIDRVTSIAQSKKCDFVIGIGGGKTLDTAKCVASKLKLDVASVPTTASTDAPATAVAALYHPDGAFDHYVFFERNPAIVLVDTSLIAWAPPRFLASGVGDALATNIEAKLITNRVNFAGGIPGEMATAIREKCEDVLVKYAKLAYEANKIGVVTPAFEAVVEANTLLSGLGVEAGGVAAAHAIHNGLTAIEELHHLLHGEKVAFGIVAQLVLSNTPPHELEKYLSVLLSVNLPITFEQLGISDVTDEQLRAVAKLATAETETVWCLESVVNEDVVYGAIKAADAVGKQFVRKMGWKKE
ncbi:glycerol dehydrogenase [Panus rudis PR-1116 ss-1]|nr:glycerol dehydrogenase [Panus rudis PR-1116 ss-1]